MNSPFSRMSTSKTKLAAGHFYSQRQWSFWWPFSDFLGSFKGYRLLKSWKHENISLGLEGYKEDTTAISRNRSPWSDGIPLCGLGFDNQVPWVGHDSVSQAFFVSLVKEMLPARWGSVLCGGGGLMWWRTCWASWQGIGFVGLVLIHIGMWHRDLLGASWPKFPHHNEGLGMTDF